MNAIQLYQCGYDSVDRRQKFVIIAKKNEQFAVGEVKLKDVKSFIIKVMFELLVITFGVLIALGINAWYNNYQAQQQASSLLGKIAYELEKNIGHLQRVQQGYNENIEKTSLYESKLGQAIDIETGTSARFEFVLVMLNTDQGAWQFSKTRNELNTLPVELLITLDLANRSTVNAQTMVNDFIFHQHDSLSTLVDIDKNEAYLDAMEREFTQLKFNIDIALLSSERALAQVKEFQKTGAIAPSDESLSLSTQI